MNETKKNSVLILKKIAFAILLNIPLLMIERLTYPNYINNRMPISGKRI